MIILLFSLVFANEPKFLKKCYQDYVHAFMMKPPDDIFAQQKVRKRCVSRDFVNSDEDADGLLLAQDYQESWRTHIEVKVTSKDTADVVLGTGAETHCLSVTHQKSKITAVVDCKK